MEKDSEVIWEKRLCSKNTKDKIVSHKEQEGGSDMSHDLLISYPCAYAVFLFLEDTHEYSHVLTIFSLPH